MSTQPVLLGDPHLGRRFTRGVPVERRGQREQLVREDFVRQLDPRGSSTHITMGDLFDAPQVPYDDLLFAAQAYRAASVAHPGTSFFILQGNHDDSRDRDEVTAWDVFQQLMLGVMNVTCVVEPMICARFALFPWQPFKTAAEMVAETSEWLCRMKPPVAYGHWDTDPRSSPHNLIPTYELAMCEVRRAYTGHIHKPDSFRRDGVEVVVVGSMQPYAQGEDGLQSGHIRYATVTLAALRETLDLGLGDQLRNQCIRLQLAPGEQWEGAIPDCLSFDIQRVRPADEPAPADVSMEGFDTTAAARAALDEHDILPEIRDQIDRRWSEVFGRDG